MATQLANEPDEMPEEIILAPQNLLPQAAGSPKDIVEYFKLYQQITKDILTEDDYQEISYKDKAGKEIKKKFKKKSAFRKYQVAFNISDRIIEETREDRKDHFIWRIKVEASTRGGRTSVGVGACSSNERGFAHLEHDVYSTAHTRAKNRAVSDIMGAGEVSAEEMTPHDLCKCATPKPSFSNFCMNAGCGKQVK